VAVWFGKGGIVKPRLGITRTAIAAALAAASGLAFAVDELEPNASIATAQRLVIGPDSRAEVTGVIGNATGLVIADVDFYVFQGRAGDLVTIDIDGGMKPRFSGLRSVDTIVALFGPGGKKLADNNDVGLPLDPGSVHQFDARIDNFKLPANGTYAIGVSSNPRHFLDGGALGDNTLGRDANGSYTLVISGVSPSLLRINVGIKGANGEPAPINPKSKGNVPVMLLSSAEFNAADVDPQSLRFGAKGDESSLLRCNKGYTDVNGDGKPDLICHFDTQTAGFGPGDAKGIVTGSLKDGRQFEGHDVIKIVPVKQ
jgi:Bacterial pre-peptidase C-terminal domain